MIAALEAPKHWRCIEFISDLHLQASQPATFSAWCDYLRRTDADALFILGDLFEVWVGDDIPAADDTGNPAAFEARCVSVLREASGRLPVYVMHGNRDFLLGSTFAQGSGCQLLADPCRLVAGGQPWLLSHGDALCLSDLPYMAFRAEVRSAAWQQNFLGQPRPQREALARHLRQQSEQRKRTGADYADLDPDRTIEWLTAANARTLIHGHTHQGTNHLLENGFCRVVLSDWDAEAALPRGEVLQLRLDPTGQASPSLQRIPLFPSA